MRVRARKAVALVVAIAIVLALLFSLLVVFSDPAAAHAEMNQSAPRPDQVVGGAIGRVDMAFREPIRPHQSNAVALQYPDGTVALVVIIPVAVVLAGWLFWPRRGRSPRRQH